ncbi:MAG: dihydroneopterin aldolase [Acidimicrobiia bacterium]
MTDGPADDLIELRGLVATGYCGVLPEEQLRPQPLEVDLDLHVDMRRPGTTDSLGDTVDYGAVCAAVENVLTTERFTLLERLAQRVAEVALADDRTEAVTVTVRKLRPPVAQPLRTAGVRVHRARPGARAATDE